MADLALTEPRYRNHLNAGDPMSPWALPVWAEKIDQWSGFDQRLLDGRDGPFATPPRWVTQIEDIRRILAYRVARAAQEGVVRVFHDRDGLSSDYDETREHGHVASFIERMVDSILGEAPRLLVDGVDCPPPAAPVLPRRPDELKDGADEIETLAHDAAMEVYKRDGRKAVEEWKADTEKHPGLKARNEWLNDWADQTGFWPIVFENEIQHVAPLGDGVLVLSLDRKGRPKVTTVDPEGFHKIYRDTDIDFPSRVHLAWQIVETNTQGVVTEKLRRVTYEIMEAPAWRPAYATEDSTERCYWSDATWTLSAPGLDMAQTGVIPGRPADINELPLEAAVFAVVQNPLDPEGPPILADRVPFPIDFIPVVHVKHTLHGRWGQSALSRVMALFDDMNAGDTAAALVASLCGEPPIAFSGGVMSEDVVIGSGSAISLGENGKAAKLGFADELRALLEYQGHLERQIQKVTSLSSELSGRENREQSGRAIGLKMTPFRQMILRARLAREDSYRLLAKMIQRFAIVGKADGFEGTDVMQVEVKWGRFIPEEMSEVVQWITLLRDRQILTDEDVYHLLVEAGLDVEDVRASLRELRAVDIKTAEGLEAMFGPTAAAQYMGRQFDPADLPVAPLPQPRIPGAWPANPAATASGQPAVGQGPAGNGVGGKGGANGPSAANPTSKGGAPGNTGQRRQRSQAPKPGVN